MSVCIYCSDNKLNCHEDGFLLIINCFEGSITPIKVKVAKSPQSRGDFALFEKD